MLLCKNDTVILILLQSRVKLTNCKEIRTLHKGTTKLTESKNIRKKRKFKLLMRYMYLTFEVCNGCYFC